MSASRDQDSPPLPPINITDSQTIKHTLDDQVIAYIKVKGYEENMTPVIASSVISIVAIALSVYGHFLPYPSEKVKVISCVSGFGLCTCLLRGLKSIYGKNSLLCTKPRESQMPAHVQKLGKLAPGFSVSTSMEPRQDIYKVTITPRPCAESSTQLQEITKDLSVFEFFDVAGNFLRNKFHDRLGEVLEAYVSTAIKKDQ